MDDSSSCVNAETYAKRWATISDFLTRNGWHRIEGDWCCKHFSGGVPTANNPGGVRRVTVGLDTPSARYLEAFHGATPSGGPRVIARVDLNEFMIDFLPEYLTPFFAMLDYWESRPSNSNPDKRELYRTARTRFDGRTFQAGTLVSLTPKYRMNGLWVFECRAGGKVENFSEGFLTEFCF